MKRREEYRAKITDDTGVIRSRVPSPLLKQLKAKPGDQAVFRVDGDTATLKIVRLKKTKTKKPARS